MLILLHLLLALAFVTSHADPPGPVTIQLDPWGDDSIRVRIVPNNSKIVDQTLMALLPDPPKTTTKVVPFTNAQISNGNLNVNVDENTGFLVATRLSDKKVLLNTTALNFVATSAIVTKSNSYAITLTFAGHGSNERVYGLGEHRTSKVNQMPFYKNFSDSQLYSDSTGSDVSIPWYCSSEGYGFVWNTPSYGSVNITGDSITWFTYAAQNLDIWITTTSDPAYAAGPFANLLSNYIDAVGHAPAMPTYATGFIQCKDRYRNQSQLLDVARGYVTRGLPISVIVIDWQHWVNQGDWSFNSACWPNPQAMYDELQTLGIELMVTVWPFQTPTSQHWNEFNSSAFLVPLSNGTLAPYDNGQYLYDATNSKARTAFINDVMAGYGQYGIKTFWLDAAEPEHSDNTLTWAFQEGTDVEVGEAWVQQHVRAVADGMAARGIGPSDYFVLPRSAWAGTWQYSAALWSGDITSSFQELAIQVTVAQGVAMSGVPLWTTDIGGYQGGDPTDPVFQELIVRWFQFGAFCPLFRLHGHRPGGPPSDQCGPTNGDNEVWNLATDPDHYSSIVAVMELRENLRSYVAKINQEAVKTGLPMLRPMFLAFPNDTGVSGSDVENQFMFGPDWLVAPVTTYGASQWSVYLPVLPTGTTWIYWWQQKDYGSGGARVTVNTPITEFPLFYRREN